MVERFLGSGCAASLVCLRPSLGMITCDCMRPGSAQTRRSSGFSRSRFSNTTTCLYRSTSASFDCVTKGLSFTACPTLWRTLCLAPPAPAAMACKYFACDFGPKCCGVSMRVGKFPCVAHTVGRSFRAVHVKKTCMGACGRVYYLNKKTSSEQLGVHDVRTHTFHPWSDGEPEWIASKSGKTICSVALLMSFAIVQCTMRWVLQQCAFGPSTSHSRSDRLTQTCANLLSDLDSRSTHN